ncbi:MAG: LysE family transporter [Patescibacteria group bacterium]
MGFLTNMLNPKATIFLSLFTLVLAPDTPGAVMGILSVIMVTSTMAWFSLMAIMLTHQRIRGVYERSQGVFSKTFGALLVGLGVKIAFAHK